eukprot:352421-Chlamydomonas_euryale.AAC.40
MRRAGGRHIEVRVKVSSVYWVAYMIEIVMVKRVGQGCAGKETVSARQFNSSAPSLLSTSSSKKGLTIQA